ncbi:hypothetical protein RTP6_005820 [Batrachochytrium dendrobatidis]
MTKFKLVFSGFNSVTAADAAPTDRMELPDNNKSQNSLYQQSQQESVSTTSLPCIPNQAISTHTLQNCASTPILHRQSKPKTIQSTVSPSTKTAKCPICGYLFFEVDLPAHYKLELSTIDNNPYTQDSLASHTERSKRGAAVAAMSKIQDKPKALSLVDENEKNLQRVRVERIKRGTSRGGSLSSNHSNRKRQKGSLHNQQLYNDTYDNHPDESICFICGCLLPRGAALINEHLDRCLVNGTQSESILGSGIPNTNDSLTAVESPSGSKSWLEYSWGGQTRVRATALLEGNFEASGFTVNKKENVDTEEDIDIDEDGTDEFGIPQFNEDDIKPYMDAEVDIDGDGPEPDLLLAEAISASLHAPPVLQPSGSDPVNTMDTGFESNHSKLVIESLKAHIRELELSAIKVPKCLICMDPYIEPLASTVCWHVHCQACWLHTLATKRLCPQCQKITSPNDLRRIYL